ncbi:hypothetical protein [Rhizobium sp. RAF56]|uniref:hypothetical protein n=1 Tax=Rhizobium sp. RAF56 TaxID=3233062 RepID=UPI003F947C02
MLSTDRDCKRGGERFAIPTLGEVEGKLIVMEVVALACLRERLKQRKARSISHIRQNIKRDLACRCRTEGLCFEDQTAAADYGLQLLDSAIEAASAEQATEKKTLEEV